jgi:hypothetical protein
MKLIPKLATLAATTLVLAVASVHGDTFDYSYTSYSNVVVTGQFDGIASGNLINDISNVSLDYDGTLFGPSVISAAGYQIVTGYTVGTAVVSFDGTQNDFAFSNFVGGLTTLPNFASLTNFPGSINFVEGSNGQSFEDYQINSSWSVTDVSTRSVPDGGAMIGMLGGALASLAALRRRFAK